MPKNVKLEKVFINIVCFFHYIASTLHSIATLAISSIKSLIHEKSETPFLCLVYFN
jgi:hypothetical protein